jgi:hypothetical protein
VAIDAVAEAVLDQPVRPTPKNLPASFGPAQTIVQSLKQLASEMEDVSKEVGLEPREAESSSAQAIEACLLEIRTIREAEAELRQQVGGE